MTRYQGGKAAIGTELAAHIMKYAEHVLPESRNYLEPFCGMLSVLTNITNPQWKRHAADRHPDLIQMHRAIANGWLPSHDIDLVLFDKHDYDEVKSREHTDKLKAFIGFGTCHSGMYMSSFVRYTKLNTQNSSAQAAEAGIVNNLVPHLCPAFGPSDIEFTCQDYRDWGCAPCTDDEEEQQRHKLQWKDWVIYCDPPYASTNGYNVKGGDTRKTADFDNEEFWTHMREWSGSHLVFISEYTAPDDFVCVWEKDGINKRHLGRKSADKKTQQKGNNRKTEKLFVHKEWHTVFERVKQSREEMKKQSTTPLQTQEPDAMEWSSE